MTYKVVTYNGNTGHFSESVFDHDLEGAIELLKIKCNDIIDDFANDYVRMKASMFGFNKAIRIFDVDDEKNYYVVFLKEVKYD